MAESQAEQEDRVKTVAEVRRLKTAMYDQMVTLSSLNDGQLKMAGHKSLDDALKYTLEHTRRQIAKTTTDFFNKHPD